MVIKIREMLLADAAEIAALMPDFGYDATMQQCAQRFVQLHARPDNVCLVAEQDGRVVGWLHAYGVRSLATDGYVEIGGLVVATNDQRKGIGRALMRQSEAWAAGQNYMRVRLRSGVHREDAHLFYAAMGVSTITR